MAIVVNKTFMSKVEFTVGADTYTTAVRDLAMPKTAVESSVVDASGSTVPFVGKSVYRVTGVLYQDWTSTGLAKNWFTNEGSQATVKFTLPGTQGVWTATVILIAPDIGGPTNQVAESSFSLPVVGTPTWSAS